MNESAQNIPDAFDDDLRIDWQRVPVEKDNLAHLMQRSDLRGWLQTIAHLGLFFCTAALAYAAFTNIDAANWPWAVPLAIGFAPRRAGDAADGASRG